MLHQMRLEEEPFEKIRSGKKTLELRLWDEKRKSLKLGDEIEFLKRPDLKEKIKCRVIGLLLYENFADLIEDVPAAFLGYEESEKGYLKESMYGIYPQEEEKQYGALGIRIKLVQD